jgi:hypothetical protein
VMNWKGFGRKRLRHNRDTITYFSWKDEGIQYKCDLRYLRDKRVVGGIIMIRIAECYTLPSNLMDRIGPFNLSRDILSYFPCHTLFPFQHYLCNTVYISSSLMGRTNDIRCLHNKMMFNHSNKQYNNLFLCL